MAIITSTVAKEEDGTIQITFSIPKSVIDTHETQTLTELAKSAKVAGFRPGKAPLEKVKANITKEKLLEQTLSKILPKAFSESIAEHKIKPATFPKFEILSQATDWQIRATTSEIVDFELGDYRKIVKDALASLPKEEPARNTSHSDAGGKEQKALSALVDAIKITIPHILIEEEVNMRLSQLLERIEKLGLTLEGYLASIGKTPESIRKEYQKQSKMAISLELILNKIAQSEKIEVPHEEIHKAMAALGGDPKEDPHLNQDKHRAVESVLRRRAVLDSLITNV